MRLLLLGALATLTACASPMPDGPSSPPEEEPIPHFAGADALNDAVFTGELDRVHAEADRFVELHARRDYPLTWHSQLVPMMAWAEWATRAEDIDDATLAVEQVMASCDACHRDGVASR